MILRQCLAPSPKVRKRQGMRTLQAEQPAVKISIFFRCGIIHPPLKVLRHIPYLYRRAGNRSVRAKHAAIARLGSQQCAAPGAVVEKLASVGRHGFDLRGAAGRARQRGFQRLHQAKMKPSRVSKAPRVSVPVSKAVFTGRPHTVPGAQATTTPRRHSNKPPPAREMTAAASSSGPVLPGDQPQAAEPRTGDAERTEQHGKRAARGRTECSGKAASNVAPLSLIGTRCGSPLWVLSVIAALLLAEVTINMLQSVAATDSSGKGAPVVAPSVGFKLVSWRGNRGATSRRSAIRAHRTVARAAA